MKSNVHVPVLLKESIVLLDIQPNGIYVDCTSGRGGHSSAILNKLSSKGKLICIDTDEEAIIFLKQKFSKDKNVTVLKGNFKDITSLLNSINIYAVDGLIADLGVSSPMFDNPIRGFSYHDEAKLDMRMDQAQELDAEYIVNNYSEKQLIKIFKEFGEINIPNNVVKNIIKERTIHHISSTKELVDIIKKSLSWKDLNKDKHPAKVYFQALRIEVNHELDNLKELLNNQIPNILKKNGRAVVISFHSLEDRIVKDSFIELTSNKTPKEIPILIKPDFSLLTRKPITASENELNDNNRSHSAKLRGIIKNV